MTLWDALCVFDYGRMFIAVVAGLATSNTRTPSLGRDKRERRHYNGTWRYAPKAKEQHLAAAGGGRLMHR